MGGGSHDHSMNFLEPIIELRDLFIYAHQLVINDTDEDIYWVKSGRVLSTGISVLMELEFSTHMGRLTF